MKINWGIAEVVLAAIVISVGWAVSVEVRMAQHKSLENISQRLGNIEELMLPVLVDFKTRQEVEKRLAERGYRTAPPEPISEFMEDHDHDPPSIEEVIEEESSKAEDWARDAIRQDMLP
jgi:hypothetical protein